MEKKNRRGFLATLAGMAGVVAAAPLALKDIPDVEEAPKNSPSMYTLKSDFSDTLGFKVYSQKTAFGDLNYIIRDGTEAAQMFEGTIPFDSTKLFARAVG